MYLELIETFLDLCETRSFNGTAERLGITQSTVSGRIRTLEAKLGCRLFSRGRAGAALTTEGLRFEPHARNLRHSWTEAMNAVGKSGDTGVTLRIGIQHDLLDNHISDWVAAVRAAIPDTGLYVEADYSIQMNADIVAGQLDIGIMYSPKPHPDLHFESLGEVRYRMVSTETDRLEEVRADRYILPNYSPAFARTHADLHPLLSSGQVSSGQNAVIRGLLAALGGTTYLLEETAAELAASGRAALVRRAPRITQPVFAALHLRNRHRTPHRRMVQLLRAQVPSPARG